MVKLSGEKVQQFVENPPETLEMKIFVPEHEYTSCKCEELSNYLKKEYGFEMACIAKKKDYLNFVPETNPKEVVGKASWYGCERGFRGEVVGKILPKKLPSKAFEKLLEDNEIYVY